MSLGSKIENRKNIKRGDYSMMNTKIKVNIIFKPGIPSARTKGGGDQTACKMLYEALKKEMI